MAKISRIVFCQNSRYFKLVDFECGTDNSFYILPHQHDAEVGERIGLSFDEAGQPTLKIDEIKSGCFPVRKLSRHSSGYFHIKDVLGRGGQREKDGLIGPAFSAAGGFYVFLVICPQAIETLVEIPASEPSDLVVSLPDKIGPFTVQFAVRDNAVHVDLKVRPGELLGNGVVTLTIDNMPFGLVIMLPLVEKASPDIDHRFPVRTCYLLR